MHDFDGTFFDDKSIQCKVVHTDGFWLYSFREMDIARDDEESHLRDLIDPKNILALDAMRKGFETVVFKSDFEAPPSKVKSMYGTGGCSS